MRGEKGHTGLRGETGASGTEGRQEVNECLNQGSVCSDQCLATAGGFVCTCHEGKELVADTKQSTSDCEGENTISYLQPTNMLPIIIHVVLPDIMSL